MHHPSSGRACARAAAGTAAVGLAAVGLAGQAWTATAPAVRMVADGQLPAPDQVVLAFVLVVAAVAAAALAVGLGALTVSLAAPSVRTARRMAAVLTPRAVRRAVVIGVVATSGALPAAAHASEADLADLLWPVAPAVSVVDPSPDPPHPTPATAPASPRLDRTTSAGAASPRPTVVIRPGDSLWSVAAAHLDTPTPAEVAAEWPRWYAHNRDVIGDDPDLIRPGLVLDHPGEHA